MRLQLTRPLAFFDIESTGTNKDTDRIIELAIKKLFPDGLTTTKVFVVNPTIPIPPESSAIHGFTDEMVKDCPTFQEISEEVFAEFDGCDVAGFNSNAFDVPLLYNEFNRACIEWDVTKFKMLDAGNLFKIEEQRTLTAAYKFYCGKVLENAHGAEADISATMEVFFAQLERYPHVPTDLGELEVYCNYGNRILDISGKFTYDKDGDIIFNFGPHRNKKAKENIGFVQWMASRDFASDTLSVCESLMNEYYF